jgi:uncharacterized membrane protein
MTYLSSLEQRNLNFSDLILNLVSLYFSSVAESFFPNIAKSLLDNLQLTILTFAQL